MSRGRMGLAAHKFPNATFQNKLSAGYVLLASECRAFPFSEKERS